MIKEKKYGNHSSFNKIAGRNFLSHDLYLMKNGIQAVIFS